jgi:hypothetical protein
MEKGKKGERETGDITLGNSTNPMGDSGEKVKRDIEERGKPGKTSMKWKR